MIFLAAIIAAHALWSAKIHASFQNRVPEFITYLIKALKERKKSSIAKKIGIASDGQKLTKKLATNSLTNFV